MIFKFFFLSPIQSPENARKMFKSSEFPLMKEVKSILGKKKKSDLDPDLFFSSSKVTDHTAVGPVSLQLIVYEFWVFKSKV
jgi:hypothetical protein